MKKKNLVAIGSAAIVIIAGIGGYQSLAGNKEDINEPVMAMQEESGREDVKTPVPIDSPAPTATPVPTESPLPTATPISEITEEGEETVTEDEEQQLVQEDVEAGVIEVPEEVNVTALDTYLYATRDVNLREKASTGAGVLLTVAASTKVHVVGITEDGQWYQVTEVQGNNGFISAAYLQQTAPTTQQVKQTVETEKAIEKEIEESEKKVEQTMKEANVDNMSDAEFDAWVMEGITGGTTDMSTLNNLPTYEYQGNVNAGGILHAQ